MGRRAPTDTHREAQARMERSVGALPEAAHRTVVRAGQPSVHPPRTDVCPGYGPVSLLQQTVGVTGKSE